MGAEFGLVWCCFLLPLHPRYYSAYRHGHRRNADSLESTTNSGNFQGEIGIRTLDSFFRCPLSASKHRHPCRGATHPPLTHRLRNSLSAQTPSLSSPDEPIVFYPDKLSCYTGSPYSAQITPAQTHRAYTPTHKGEGIGSFLAGRCIDARVPYTMLLLRPLLLVSYPKYLAFNLRSTSSIGS